MLTPATAVEESDQEVVAGAVDIQLTPGREASVGTSINASMMTCARRLSRRSTTDMSERIVSAAR